MKKFSEFITIEKEPSHPPVEQLEESSFLSKGYSIIQGSRHSAAATKLRTSTSKARSITNRGKSEQNVSTKIDILYDAIDEISRALEHNASMSSAQMHATVATTVLAENVKKEIENLLIKLKKK